MELELKREFFPGARCDNLAPMDQSQKMSRNSIRDTALAAIWVIAYQLILIAFRSLRRLENLFRRTKGSKG
jgi:hypothetical protein